MANFGEIKVLKIVDGISVTGSVVFPGQTVTKSTNYDVQISDKNVVVTASAIMTLPDATTCPSAEFTIVSTTTDAVSVYSSGGTINGFSDYSITQQYRAFTFFSDGTNYFIK